MKIPKGGIKPKQTLKDIKEKWKRMRDIYTDPKTNSNDPLFCGHTHCLYWRDSVFNTKKVWKKDLDILEKEAERQWKARLKAEEEAEQSI